MEGVSAKFELVEEVRKYTVGKESLARAKMAGEEEALGGDSAELLDESGLPDREEDVCFDLLEGAGDSAEILELEGRVVLELYLQLAFLYFLLQLVDDYFWVVGAVGRLGLPHSGLEILPHSLADGLFLEPEGGHVGQGFDDGVLVGLGVCLEEFLDLLLEIGVNLEHDC